MYAVVSIRPSNHDGSTWPGLEPGRKATNTWSVKLHFVNPPSEALPVVAPRRRHRRRTFVLVSAATLVLLLTLPIVWVQVAGQSKVSALDDVPARPVALVLGAGLRPNGTPSTYLTRRLDAARQLYEAGTVQVILVSGDNSKVEYDEPTAMLNWLVDAGVPADRIVRDYAGLDTHDSCRRAADLFGVTGAIVITQDYHLPRALFSCSQAGVDTVGVGVSSTSVSTSDAIMYRVREGAASLKAAVDALTNRAPAIGGQPETGVQDALKAAQAQQN